jgi:hypothetical protein
VIGLWITLGCLAAAAVATVATRPRTKVVRKASSPWAVSYDLGDYSLNQWREDYAHDRIDYDTLVSRIEYSLGFPPKPIEDERPADVRIARALGEARMRQAMTQPITNGKAAIPVPIFTQSAMWTATNSSSYPGSAVPPGPQHVVELVDGTGKVVRTVPVSEARKIAADREWKRMHADDVPSFPTEPDPRLVDHRDY